VSSVIKSAQAALGSAVRAVPVRLPADAVNLPQAESREIALERRITELETQLAAQRDTAAELASEAKASFARGEAAGRKEGQRLADDRQTQRLTLLAEGIAASQMDFAAGLAETERLAVLLAVACLEKIFGDEAPGSQRVSALLRVQMSRIERDQLVKVIVSAADFSEEALQDLHAVVAGKVDIIRDPDLPTGGCKLIPRLGEIDIGLDTQWQAVRGFLLEMVMSEALTC